MSQRAFHTHELSRVFGRVVVLEVGHSNAGCNTSRDTKAENEDGRDLLASGHLQTSDDVARNSSGRPVSRHLDGRDDVADCLQSDDLLACPPRSLLAGCAFAEHNRL